MSDTEAESFDLVSVEIIREESAVITVKIPKGHCGELPDILTDATLGDQIFDALEPLEWICNDLRMGLYWNTHRPSAHVFDARAMIQKAGGIIPESASESSEPEE